MQAEFCPHFGCHADLPFAAVYQHGVGKAYAFAVFARLLHFAVAAGEHFAHGGVVVACFGGGDVVAAVLAGLHGVVVIDDAAGEGGFALGVADVKAF